MRLSASPAFYALALLFCLSFACSKGPRDERKATPPPASASAGPVPEPAPSVSAARLPAPPTPICRVLRLVGSGKVGEVELSSGAELDGSEWVTLEKGASLTLKHSASGRELLVAGPARFRACRRGREQLLLVRGKVTGGGGVGARPGAEVSIATPVAAVRYADAELTVTLDDKQLNVAVRTGLVEVDSASGRALEPLRAKGKLVLPLGKPDPAALLARCKTAAEAAEASARRVADRSAPEPLGERAQAHVRARKAARSACTVAAVTTGLVADPVASAGLWAEAARWEGLWESVPRRSREGAPEK
jgi:hypothetical protein